MAWLSTLNLCKFIYNFIIATVKNKLLNTSFAVVFLCMILLRYISLAWINASQQQALGSSTITRHHFLGPNMLTDFFIGYVGLQRCALSCTFLLQYMLGCYWPRFWVWEGAVCCDDQWRWRAGLLLGCFLKFSVLDGQIWQ